MKTGDKILLSIAAAFFSLISISFLVSFLTGPDEMSNKQLTYMIISTIISVILIKGLLGNKEDK